MVTLSTFKMIQTDQATGNNMKSYHVLIYPILFRIVRYLMDNYIESNYFGSSQTFL